VEVGMPSRIDATSREKLELEPALIMVVHRLEEFLWISRVDEHRKLEARGRLPNGIELGVVEGEARTVRLADRLAEVLWDLADAHRSRSHVGLELRHRALRPPRSHVLKIDPSQHAHAILHRRRRVDRRHHPLELLTRDVISDDDHSDVEAVELSTHSR